MRADPGPMPPDDTFVSLRIGQVQRHARYAPLRTYRFDSVDQAAKTPVKLEVFKRIGQTTITFGGSTGDIQDIEVPMNGGGPLRMRLSTADARATTPGYTEKKKSRGVNGARTYLAQHNLENLLKDAIKEVMSAKPANPHEYLAAYILNAGLNASGSAGGLLPRIGANADSRGELPIPAGKTVPKWAAPDSAAPTFANKDFASPPRTLPPVEGKALGQSASAPTLQQWAPPPTPPKRQTAAVSVQTDAQLESVLATKAEPPAEPPLPEKPWKFRPSVATWCSLITPTESQEAPPFQATYPSSAVAGKVAKPTWQFKPSVGSWFTIRLPERPAEAPVYRAFNLRPSVATWAAPLPSTDPADQTAYRKWNLRPSTGTWVTTKIQRSLEELTHWEPPLAETQAMNVILAGRTDEINDLSQKLREVTASLEVARATGSGEAGELENTAQALQKCVAYAQNEYDALEQWSMRRGLSQPSSSIGNLATIA